MNMFSALRAPREIVFGAGQRACLAAIAQQLGKRALVCSDARLAAEPVFEEIISSLRSSGMVVEIESGVLPDVPVDSCLASAERARSFAPDVVIGVGGGSCIDHAKCVALLLKHGGEPQDYYGEFKVPGPVLPIIAIPTTAGTGSEVTPVAVLSDAGRLMKVGISSPHLIPAAAICDPELTVTCPKGLTAAAGADALTHAIEAFTAIRRAPVVGMAQERVFIGKTAITDHFARLAIQTLFSNLERAYTQGDDLAAREQVMLGALMAGLAFGTAGTAAAHAIQYPVGAATHTAHGDGVACVLPYVMRFNLEATPDVFAEIGRMIGLQGNEDIELGKKAVDAVAKLFAAVGIPSSLKALGLAEDKLEWAGDQALGVSRLIDNNPRQIDAAAMTALMRAAYEGDFAPIESVTT
ncbi:iron-containing alcohol dehydrogenase [Mariluticola halotolerans]|uniref:iron-containing alcohol dehydrogenase n=1 Tax=Mariluticola halotolerans TaxID=2909283 RepID=UPI0026E2B982|nr:iron-containing alcohol dehydrogenase [Mariluticola halotolerans]UJQ94733.1 iron-containing alcohol dehydrogenase [Mariluticola halotolerans]